MVGWAVRRGANSRGGWVYQTLAVCLTYSAIVSTYIPGIFTQIKKAKTEAKQTTVGSTNTTELSLQTTGTVASSADQEPEIKVEKAGSSSGSVVGWIVAIFFLFGFACVVPFLGRLSIIGWVIIAIALYEAWKLNKRAALQITGPHQVGANPLPPVA